MKFTLVTIFATLAITALSSAEVSLQACDNKCYNQCYLDWCITPDPFGNLSCILACSDICGCL
ncbi:hypothetical protein BHE90_000150 [Fusarium euwallaceae]|uniref:Extracellular membrane protein CFEM domain-containing protein n=2 Tax=Fusarium solani species complex TaxID=232080 RepID=A0A430MBI6_9HYPO|nr:hypothetical protein CEP51_005167 [Fusarium floridanum]RTE85303.1 hypothetical protein BHE90_000150 [Fusarium euwallaceae]